MSIRIPKFHKLPATLLDEIKQGVKAIVSANVYVNTRDTRIDLTNELNLYLRGYEQDRKIYSFKVVCDTSNNTPEVIDRNELRALILVKEDRSIVYKVLDVLVKPGGISVNTNTKSP